MRRRLILGAVALAVAITAGVLIAVNLYSPTREQRYLDRVTVVGYRRAAVFVNNDGPHAQDATGIYVGPKGSDGTDNLGAEVLAPGLTLKLVEAGQPGASPAWANLENMVAVGNATNGCVLAVSKLRASVVPPDQWRLSPQEQKRISEGDLQVLDIAVACN